MQLIGIYINKATDSIKKVLKDDWYGFYAIKETDKFLSEFKNQKAIKEKIQILKKHINCQENQEFIKNFYDYQGNQLSINAIVGKNGSGKSTILDIYNRIINNFAARIKNEFPQYNVEYEIKAEEGLWTELYYECNDKIYCIEVNDKEVNFINEDDGDLFQTIKKSTADNRTDLEKLSEHIFYTIACNYSLYTDYPEWMRTLYHKNDGYFTPIVLVPYRSYGNIEIERERKLAEKRVQTLSILLYKDNQTDFIENYLPYKIEYELKTPEFYEKHEEYQTDTFDDEYRINKYEEVISNKIDELETHNKFINEKNNEGEKNLLLTVEEFKLLKNSINDYWDEHLKDKEEEIYNYYCKLYLQYKTLKSIVNYETIARLVDFTNLKASVKKIIEEQLWDDSKINYINLKIIMCKRFMEYSYKKIYKESAKGTININDDFITKEKIKEANTYHDIFSYLLPDFFETHFYYKKKEDTENKISTEKTLELMELSQMSSGEQQLYNSLSYVVYHIKNAQSNKNGNSEGKIPYKYFNLIFDEAELYYHPEYQREFMSNIIKLLNRSNLGIEGLNITVVTHSPFILSDIPRNNILALEDGNISEKLNETLAANIYDLLENQFFMTSTIGECSKLFIERIIADCESSVPLDEKKYTRYNNFIDKIGDEYLKIALREMLEDKHGISFIERRKIRYQNKIDILETIKNEKN